MSISSPFIISITIFTITQSNSADADDVVPRYVSFISLNTFQKQEYQQVDSVGWGSRKNNMVRRCKSTQRSKLPLALGTLGQLVPYRQDHKMPNDYQHEERQRRSLKRKVSAHSSEGRTRNNRVERRGETKRRVKEQEGQKSQKVINLHQKDGKFR